MGTQHHAVVGVDVYQSSPMISSPCLTAPAHPDQKRPICGVFDLARVNGYGLAPLTAEVRRGKGCVEAEPVQDLQAKATEVLAVAQFAVFAVAVHLGEVYLSWDNHV